MKARNQLLCLALLMSGAAHGASEVITLDRWRSHEGDSPAWARADFNDSSWQESPAPTAARFGNIAWGVTWYRTKFAVAPKDRGLDMAMGVGPLDEAYDVFVEGALVGRFGHWQPTPGSPTPRHLAYRIPAALLTGEVAHVAIRRWRGGAAPAWLALNSTGAGRLPHAPVVGEPFAIETAEQLHTLTAEWQNLPWIMTYLLVLAAAAVSMAFYSTQRRQIEYLFMGAYFACFGVPLLAAMPLFQGGPSTVRSPLAVATVGIWAITFTLSILILARICPRYRIFFLAAAGVIAIGDLAAPIMLATGSGVFFRLYQIHVLILPIPFFVAVWGLRNSRDKGALSIAASLSLFSLTDGYGGRLAVTNFIVGPFRIDSRCVGEVLFVLTTLTVLYLRFRRDQARQALQNEDLAAARRMQQTLLARAAGSTPGYAVQAAYIPAREVGGDFFQEIPGDDGSLVVAAGDVSGKGLDAAMVVAVIAGALRRETSRDPGRILANLNRVLLSGNRQGFVTCCCLRILEDGAMVVSNAGHLAPYVDGRELSLPNALPLGIAEAPYEETRVSLPPGYQITVVSDGVVEAANGRSELFGFTRTQSISTQSAKEIAEAAKAWGQTDDITVVTVRRTA